MLKYIVTEYMIVFMKDPYWEDGNLLWNAFGLFQTILLWKDVKCLCNSL